MNRKKKKRFNRFSSLVATVNPCICRLSLIPTVYEEEKRQFFLPIRVVIASSIRSVARRSIVSAVLLHKYNTWLTYTICSDD